MKRFFLLFVVVFLLFQLSACAHLKIKPDMWFVPEETPDKRMIEELNGLLNAVSYPKKYELDVFDCSNMSAYMHDFLTARGYKCAIFLGTTSLRRLIFGKGDFGRGHAWLLAEKHGKKFWVEATARLIAPPDWYEPYCWQLRFNSLEELKEFWKSWHLPEGEWAWDY